ncbi:MAG: carboxypeptidase regulatory-like domain-containing protein, partial [Acidobacteria bacterium]|nr:carboxypeptidase regulatory-like domain-containing protein [Acidobacteriota bacterium]
MGRLCGVSVVAFWCVLSVATTTSAQAIGGTITDSTGAVLPGVTVEVRSPALIEQVRAAVSDGAGEYLIIALEPGTYSATFVLPGFSTFVREGIELVGTATATVDGRLQIGALDETITVSGASPLVDVQNVNQQAVMTREVIDAIPTGKAFNNLGVLVPGMVTGTTYGVGQDVGGQSGQSHQRMAIHGGAESDQRIMVDGMSMSPWTQEDASLVWLSDGNFEEVQVDHSVISAETETGGVRFNMIPRSGGNTFSSRSFFNFSAQRLQADNLTPELTAAGLPEPNRVKSLWSVNPSIGGPIVRDKLWFFGSYTRQVADSFVAFFEDVDPNASFYTADLTRQAFDDQSVHDATVRLTWQASPRDKIQFYFDDNSNIHGHFLIGTALAVNVMPSASVNLFGDIQTYQASWTSAISSRLLLEVAFGALPQDQVWRNQEGVNTELPGILEVGS